MDTVTKTAKSARKPSDPLAIWTKLEKEYEDPIAHFKAVAKEMDTQRKQETYGYDLCINQQEKLSVGTDNMKNFGYAALSKIYHELELDSFLKNRQRHTEDTFDANAVLQALTYLKIVAPAADSTFFIDRELFFEKNSGTKDEFYQGLMFLYHLKHPLHSWINESYHKSRHARGYHGVLQHPQLLSPSHVIRIGVFTDRALMPVTYDLFPCTSNYTYL